MYKRQILYGLQRINEPATEHVDNHFTPVNAADVARYMVLRNRLIDLMEQSAEMLGHIDAENYRRILDEGKLLRKDFASLRHDLSVDLQTADRNMTAATLLLHVVQESEQVDVELRDLMKHCHRFHELL